MRAIVLVLLTLLITPAVAFAGHHQKGHPHLQELAHKKRMKKAVHQGKKDEKPGLLHHKSAG
jgi:hypothetical protein